MARDFGPFPSRPMYEVVNRRMQRALAEASSSTGFAKAGQGAVTAGTGAELVIAAYPDGALVDGQYVENPDSETVTLTTNTASSNPRIDRLVMRLDMGAETIAPFQIVGTPGASPSAPPLVKTATVFDMPLCQYRFPGSASAQNPGSIVDERVRAAAAVIPTAPKLATGTTTTATNLGPAGTTTVVVGASVLVPDPGAAYELAVTGVSAFNQAGGGTQNVPAGKFLVQTSPDNVNWTDLPIVFSNVLSGSSLSGIAAWVGPPVFTNQRFTGPAYLRLIAFCNSGTGYFIGWRFASAPALSYQIWGAAS